MKGKWVLPAAVAGICIGVGAQVLAQPNPNQLIANRKGAMTLARQVLRVRSSAMAQGRAPFDAKIVQRNADYLAVLSQMPWDDFQPASLGLQNTRAKEEIAKDEAKFKSRVQDLQSEIQKLQAAARKGDEGAVKAAAPAVAKACNSCHEDFSTMNFRFKI